MSATAMPLAARMRPKTLPQCLGQAHLLGPDGLLQPMLLEGQLQSMILWGPPGSGKTTLARLLSHHLGAVFYELSAVMSGVAEIRKIVTQAKEDQRYNRKSVLFIDEIHRFNKAQQDALLPHVELGVIVLIGATTENPGFEINRALLSRTIVYPLYPMSELDLVELLQRAVEQDDILRDLNHLWTASSLLHIARSAQGDARQALNQLEAISFHLLPNEPLSESTLMAYLQLPLAGFDKQGDLFYDQISALHKSLRGSDPDASLYWLCRMLAGGTDPLYLARRLTRIASEDIGNADPRALTLCLQAWDVQQRLGSPEGELALAQAVLYCAAAPKSNAVYRAFTEMQSLVKKTPAYPVPLHLRNAPTSVHQQMGASKGYQYPHDFPDGFVCGATYWPDDLTPESVYQPVDRGLETKIRAKLEHLKTLNENARVPRSMDIDSHSVARHVDDKD